MAREDVEAFKAYAREFDVMVHKEFEATENREFIFEVTEVKPLAQVIAHDTAHRLIAALFACPNGVQGMSTAIEGLIETSDNLASVKMIADGTIEITIHQRSSVDSRRDEIADRVSALFGMIGAEVTFEDAYVGWAPNPSSKVLKVAEESYRDIFKKEAKVEALHAGLECGLFLEKMPNLDMVSFGPTLKDIHSPGEKANIQSVQDFYILLKEMVTRLAK